VYLVGTITLALDGLFHWIPTARQMVFLVFFGSPRFWDSVSLTAAGRQGGVTRGYYHPVARLALRVATELQQLEVLARDGLFAPKEHDSQFGCQTRPKQRVLFL
jgi:hypothetical protein